MAENLSESKKVQAKINIDQEISKIVEKLQQIKIPYLSSELEKFHVDFLKISHGLSLLRVALKYSAKKDYMPLWEMISSFIRSTLAEVKRFSEIRLSTLNQSTTPTSVKNRLEQNTIDTNKILEELEKFKDEELIATPLKKTLLNLKKAQVEFQNDFLRLPFMKSEVDEAKQSTKEKTEIEAFSPKVITSDQPTMVPTDRLREILKETKELSRYVQLIGGGFNLHADDLVVTRAHQIEILQTSLTKLTNLRFAVHEVTEANHEILALKKEIVNLLDTSQKHLNLLNLISEGMLEFRAIRSELSDLTTKHGDVLDCELDLQKNLEAIVKLRERCIKEIPGDQISITLKLLDNFAGIQNNFLNFFKEIREDRISKAKIYGGRSISYEKREPVIASTSRKLSSLKIQFGILETSHKPQVRKRNLQTGEIIEETPPEIKDLQSGEIIKETPPLDQKEHTGSYTSIVSSTPQSQATSLTLRKPSGIEFIEDPDSFILAPLDRQRNEPNVKKPLAIGFGIFLVSLVIGVAVPAITALEIGKDETLEFLFSSDKGMCIVGGYAGLEGLLGAALIAWSIYNCCTHQSDDPRAVADNALR